MKERLLTGWTFTRGLYFALGSFIVVQSILDKQWFGVVLGGYFAAMGLFSFGCAGGHCVGTNRTQATGQDMEATTNVYFEEIKSK